MKITIGNIQFKSKDACRIHVRQMLMNLGNCEVSNGHEHFEFLQDLIKQHPKYETKKGPGIEAFIVKQNILNGKANHIDIKRTDGSIIDISWVQCCLQVNSSDLTQAMRSSVSEHVLNFKSSRPQVCEVCKQSSDQLDVHHHYVSFDTIKREFLSKTKLDLPTEFDDDKYYRATLKEGQFKTDFIEYHLLRAKYRLLCKKCHMKEHYGRIRPSICLL